MPDTPIPPERGIDPRVLGHLLLVQSTLHVLPSMAAIGDFVCHALPDVPGVARACLCLGDRRLGSSAALGACGGGTCLLDTTGCAGVRAGAGEFGSAVPARPDLVIVPLATVHRTYGRLVLGLEDTNLFRPYESHLRNLANFVAMAVENRHQQDQLSQLNEELRQEVAVRTAAEASLRDAQRLLEHKVQERTAELRASEQRLRLAQEAARIGIWDWDIALGTVRVSDGEKELYGLTLQDEEVPVGLFTTSIHADDRPAIETLMREAMSGGSVMSAEFRVRLPNGEERWLAGRGQTIRDEAGLPVRLVGINMDITERKQLEQELFQAQKLESIGRLAGGVAHDFNNLLTAILGYADMADELAPAAPVAECLAEIRAAGTRAAELTRQLLTFARRQVVAFQAVQLNTLIRDVTGMLRRLIGENISLHTELDPGLWPVMADPGQMSQLLTNLTVNARDAMPQGGRVTLRTANHIMDAAGARLFGCDDTGEYVLLVVTDTGMGMTDEVKARIFEPFFTTKELGRGTGLGLASSYGIVKQSGGHIRVESQPGQGATFHVVLPRARESSGASAVEPSAAGRRAGTETVLLAEDDTAIRAISSQTLRRWGYQVLEAVDGQQAIDVARSYPGPIHLLLSDIVMPRVGGRDLAAGLCATRPGLRVLFMSGYPDHVVNGEGGPAPVGALLPKPFTPAQLLERVRQILDQPAR